MTLIRLLIGFALMVAGLYCMDVIYGQMTGWQLLGMFLLLVSGSCLKIERRKQ